MTFARSAFHAVTAHQARELVHHSLPKTKVSPWNLTTRLSAASSLMHLFLIEGCRAAGEGMVLTNLYHACGTAPPQTPSSEAALQSTSPARCDRKEEEGGLPFRRSGLPKYSPSTAPEVAASFEVRLYL
jgi:hypothetical protein